MPRKVGTTRQREAALGGLAAAGASIESERAEEEHLAELGPESHRLPVVDVKAPAASIRVTVPANSTVARLATKMADEANATLGRNVVTPSQIVADFLRDHEIELGRMFTNSMKRG
ncbi:hypothetical protein V8J82_22490 [Gymnodinialimonas sp. 2305UL16-5]|uniref:hypothetical protein n=1 Tax=Gymnodinialimonas mytili TaxID=3126503 RepID=UPI003095AC84